MGMTISEERIIDLAVCHSNYKLDSNAKGIEYEALSHPNIIAFARALLVAEKPEAQTATDGGAYVGAAAAKAEDAEASDFKRILTTNTMLSNAIADLHRQLDYEKLLHRQAVEKLQTWVTTAAESLRREADLVLKLQGVKRAQDSVYGERNMLVRLLASIYPAGKKKTPIEGWDPEWQWCIYVDLPTGQASWHIHSRELPMFASLPNYQGEWDGHTTEEKYQRVLLATVAAASWGGIERPAPSDLDALAQAYIRGASWGSDSQWQHLSTYERDTLRAGILAVLNTQASLQADRQRKVAAALQPMEA